MQEYKLFEFARFFLENPYQEVYLRGISRKLKISTFAVKKYADDLVKKELLLEERRANLRYLKLNTSNVVVKYLKISLSLQRVRDSGIVEFILDNIRNVSSIVLFGSVAKGEDGEDSDIDLVIIGKSKTLDFVKFEKNMGREINYHVFSWNEWNKQLTENRAFYLDVVTHGISLYGELPVV